MINIEALVPLYLGIDGGGTQTTCAVGDDLRVLATSVAGGSNMVRVGEPEARANLREAITKACAAAGVSPATVEATVIGIAGASVPPVKSAVAAMIGDLVRGEIEVVGDMVIAMEAAFPGLPGVVVISGTGSVAFGRNHLGEAGRAGGWGSAISDEGSGYWIGRAAVSAVLRAHDAAASTTLLRGILDCWRLNSLGELVQKGNAAPAFRGIVSDGGIGGHRGRPGRAADSRGRRQRTGHPGGRRHRPPLARGARRAYRDGWRRFRPLAAGARHIPG